jgi:hypothetical protein
VDHDVVLENGAVVHNPTRVVPNGTGGTLIFTLLRQGVSEQQFAKDAETVDKDLTILKGLLEGA